MRTNKNSILGGIIVPMADAILFLDTSHDRIWVIMVEVSGVEPLTFCVQGRRSTN